MLNQETTFDNRNIPDTNLDVIPLANARPRKNRLPALEESANGWKCLQILSSPQFVKRLKNGMVEEPPLFAFILRHLSTRAPNLLRECLTRRVENPRGSGLNQIQAFLQVNNRANDGGVSDIVRLPPRGVPRPSQGKVWVVFPKIHSCAKPVVTLAARFQCILTSDDGRRRFQVATVIADDPGCSRLLAPGTFRAVALRRRMRPTIGANALQEFQRAFPSHVELAGSVMDGANFCANPFL
jgi:hypothetical protein